MSPEQLRQILFSSLEMANNAREEDAQIPISNDTALYGSDGYLDSMGLVAFLIDVEEGLMNAGFQISLSDERAMSQTRSPFKNIQTLTDYIQTLITEKAAV